MMKNLFRLRIEPKSEVCGIITSNTFFGVFCQAYKMVNSEDDLQIFLELMTDNSEELTFSNPLKAGTNNLITRLPKVHQSRCLVSRTQDGNNEPLSSVGAVSKQFDVLLYTTLSRSEIEKLSKIVELLGIGAHKSIGKGNIEIVSMTKEDIPEHSNKMTILSNIVPDEDTPVHGDFKFVTRTGKTMHGEPQRALVQIQAGSVLVNNTVDKPAYGRVIYDRQTCTYINCRGIAI